MEEEDEQFGPLLVTEFEKHGVSAADVKKLQVWGGGLISRPFGKEAFQGKNFKGNTKTKGKKKKKLY